MKSEWIIAKPEDFIELAEELLAAHTEDDPLILCLEGDLGAGKTTFVQTLGKVLGVAEHITSPTFGIMKRYDLTNQKHFEQLIHIDAYRIEDITETGPLRLEALCIQPRTIICIEWPERITGILPAKKKSLKITINQTDSRTVVVE